MIVWCMIRKSGYRFSEKIMLKQKDRAGCRFEEKSSRSRPRQSRAIFVWCRRIGDFAVNRTNYPTSSRWAVILLSAAVLALGGCGRKGGLDLPPNAASAEAPGAEQADAGAGPGARKPSVFNPTYGAESGPVAPKGRKKAFVLDP